MQHTHTTNVTCIALAATANNFACNSLTIGGGWPGEFRLVYLITSVTTVAADCKTALVLTDKSLVVPREDGDDHPRRQQ